MATDPLIRTQAAATFGAGAASLSDYTLESDADGNPIIRTRIPATFGINTTVVAGYAWERDEDDNLIPTGAATLTTGQAWLESDTAGDIEPSALVTITDDPFWEYDGDGNLIPTTP